MPVTTALACEVVKGYLHFHPVFENLRVAFGDRAPSAPNASNRIVHARRLARKPGGLERRVVAGVERSVELDERIEGPAIAGFGVASGNLDEMPFHVGHL